MWNEINPSLPAKPIVVIGPPPTSEQEMPLTSLQLKEGVKSFLEEELKKANKKTLQS